MSWQYGIAFRNYHIAFVLLNFYSSQRRLDKDIEQALTDLGMRIFKSRLSNRVAYKEAIIDGLGVVETKDRKAADEMQALFEEIKAIITSN